MIDKSKVLAVYSIPRGLDRKIGKMAIEKGCTVHELVEKMINLYIDIEQAFNDQDRIVLIDRDPGMPEIKPPERHALNDKE